MADVEDIDIAFATERAMTERFLEDKFPRSGVDSCVVAHGEIIDGDDACTGSTGGSSAVAVATDLALAAERECLPADHAG